MKISYDKVDFTFPLSSADVAEVLDCIPAEILDRVSAIHFGCNTRTTQEGRIVFRGTRVEIRVNFCLDRDGNTTRLLDSSEANLKRIKIFGGTVDKPQKRVIWSMGAAKKYCAFLLLHEVAHLLFIEERFGGVASGRGGPGEEKWCDDYAFTHARKLRF